MSDQLWSSVDDYFNDLVVAEDDALRDAVRASEAAGLPSIQVAPNQGKLLHILARAIGAQRILEIGTLGGYSTIWLARALPAGGRLVSLEYEQKHADVARQNLERAGVADQVEIRVGRALETLPRLEAESAGPFDLTFIDADKQSTADYFEWAVKLSRPGSLVVVDNVVRQGAVIDASSQDPNVLGMRRFNQVLHASTAVTATVVQTVGVKGHDGLAIALVG
jgi:predicted O-methyltransferase YrrM